MSSLMAKPVYTRKKKRIDLGKWQKRAILSDATSTAIFEQLRSLVGRKLDDLLTNADRSEY